MKDSVILPTALQICVDDLLWHNGDDDRHLGRPSRTGMPRKHVPEDYIVVNEIGKAIDMKIMCPIVIGEWDKDNILRGQVGTTYEPDTWDRASKIDMEYAKECFETVEKCDYIEFALHGILHGNYDKNGKQLTEMEYFEPDDDDDTKFHCMTEEQILRKFKLFDLIYNSWGFTKKFRSFVPPNGIPENFTADDILPLVNALKKKGISYIAEFWKKEAGYTTYFDGAICLEKHRGMKTPWNAYDFDPTYMCDFITEGDSKMDSVMGVHWPNFLRYNPENNMSMVPLWVNYLKRQSEIFGIILSKDIAFSANQHIYRNLSNVTVEDNRILIDVSGVYKQPSIDPYGHFYISIINNFQPKGTEGCTVELYEKHDDFTVYKITHSSMQMSILL